MAPGPQESQGSRRGPRHSTGTDAGVEKIRLFVAARVPDEHLEAIGGATRDLHASLPKARWVPPDNQHVTLKFLGWTPSARLEAVGRVIEVAAAARTPAACSVTQLGAFPSPRRARVLWAGLDNPGGLLAALASDLDAAFEPLGYRVEDRAFTPHLTLARFKVHRVELFRSRLSPSGARYESMASYELG